MPKFIGPPKVRFNLFDNNATEETYIILWYAIRKGVRFKYAIGRKVHPNNWDLKKQRAIVSKRFSEATYLNAYLKELEQLCETIYQDNPGISTDDFKRLLKARIEGQEEETEPDNRPTTLLQFADIYLGERWTQTNANEGTVKGVRTAIHRIKEYAADRRHALAFTDLDDRFFKDFKNWLYAPPRQLSDNYVSRLTKHLRTLIRTAEIRGYHTNRAYMGFKVESTPVSKIILTFDELEELNRLDLSTDTRLERVRDLFLIGAYSGLRYSDFTRITPQHIQTHEGQKVLVIKAEKTNQMIYLPIHPTLDNVLSKYGYTSPKISNQKMNDYLKELGQLAGMTQEIVINENKGGVQ